MSIVKGREGLEAYRRLLPGHDFSEYDSMSDEELSEYEFDLVPVKIAAEEVCGVPIHLDKLLVEIKFCSSRSEAQRKIKEGAVYIDGERETARDAFISQRQIESGFVVKLGRKQLKVRMEKAERSEGSGEAI